MNRVRTSLLSAAPCLHKPNESCFTPESAMKTLLSFCLLLAVVPWARADARREGEAWVLEDTQLKVTVGAENAHLTVLDKASGTLWRQEDPAKHASNKDDVRARRTAKPIVVDGNPEEWSRIPHDDFIWLPWMGDNGEANCSGGAKLMWDDTMLYLYVRIRDDNVAFGGEATEPWWESDSVEFWVDSVQVGLHLAPTGKEVAVNSGGKVFAGRRTARVVRKDHPFLGLTEHPLGKKGSGAFSRRVIVCINY